MFVVAIRGVKWKKFPVRKGWFADKIDESAVKTPQGFLFGRQTAAIVFVTVYPLHEFGHRPIIENTRTRIVPAEAFRAFGRLTDFLAVVEHDRAAREPIQNRGHRPSQ